MPIRFRNGKIKSPAIVSDFSYIPDEHNTPRTARTIRRTRLIRNGVILALLVTASLLVYFVGVAYIVHHCHSLAIVFLLGIIIYTEFYRLHPAQQQAVLLNRRVRKLVEGRRSAGLLRLEQEVKQRKQDWSYPPRSGAAAILRRDGDQFALGPEREVDYKGLCIAVLGKLEHMAKDRRRSEDTQSSHSTFNWLQRQLSQAGPLPGRDSELYRILHASLDQVDAKASDGTFHCRLCLGLQAPDGKGNVRVSMMKCGHSLCQTCTKRLLQDALAGHIGIPVACPVGCAVGGNQSTGTLSPEQVQHLLDEETYERFSRLHQVRATLGRSAPHSAGLASELACARAKLI